MRFPREPLGEVVFVKRIDEYEGPIALTGEFAGIKRGYRGKVVAVGPGRPLPDGRFIEPDVRQNDIVLFSATTGAELDMAGEHVLAMRESDILAVIETR